MRPAMNVVELLAVSEKVRTRSRELRAEAILAVAKSKETVERCRQQSLIFDENGKSASINSFSAHSIQKYTTH